jgi:hypothetical protein
MSTADFGPRVDYLTELMTPSPSVIGNALQAMDLSSKQLLCRWSGLFGPDDGVSE